MDELDFIDISRPENKERPRKRTTGSRRAQSSRREQSSRRQEGAGRQRTETQRSKMRPDQGQGSRQSEMPPGRGQGSRQSEVQPKRGQGSRQSEMPPGRGQRNRGKEKEEARRRQEMLQRRRRKRKHKTVRLVILLCEVGFIALLCFLIYGAVRSFFDLGKAENVFNARRREIILANQADKPQLTEDFLTPNPYSRPGEPLPEVNNIFVHYTANKGTSAAQNRSYFENLGITGEVSASAHFVIGYEGEIVQCIPLDEIAYAVVGRNYDSISIECCYLADDGSFTDATYQSLIRLCAWLLKEYKLTPEDMRRHYDEGGKLCPLYYVEHEEAWEQLKTDLETYIKSSEETA